MGVSFGGSGEREGRDVALAGVLRSAGERIALSCASERAGRLLAGGVAGELAPFETESPTCYVTIQDERDSFPLSGLTPVGRGVWGRQGEAVVRNVCTSGFDLHAALEDPTPRFTFRRRPTGAARVAGAVLRARDRQLARLTLLAYPALWAAARAGRAALHVGSCVSTGVGLLISGPSGVGKSTVLQLELAAGAVAVSDNLCVSDGTSVWPVAEPLRLAGVRGGRVPHGRGESPVPGRLAEAPADLLVILRRGPSGVTPLEAPAAARALVAATYQAGELRRFWSFVATLASATGIGPAHPPVVEVATTLASRIRSFEVARGAADDASVSTLLRGAGVAWQGAVA